jgi:hypothetical protein
MSALIGGAIGLILVYLAASLIVTAIQEVLANAMSLRSTQLKASVKKIIEDPKVLGNFYTNPLIEALHSDKGAPSYIPSASFSQAVTAAIAAGATADQAWNDIVKWAQTPPSEGQPSNIQAGIQSLITNGASNLAELKRGLEDWYDSVMDRVSGQYKRDVQYMTLFFGFILAVILNLDTINIASYIFSHSAVADALGNAGGAAGSNPDYTKILASLDKAGVPIGWPHFSWSWALVGGIPGWLITGFAASLGASFWFDTLKKFVNVRAAGPNPVEQASSQVRS